MNDTERLDALSIHGLCIAQISERTGGEWCYRWICHFGIEKSVEAPSIREAIDLAVSSIEIGSHQ
jgi:hypothetical protein